MAAYRRIYDSRHLQADCQAPGSAPEVGGKQVGVRLRPDMHVRTHAQTDRQPENIMSPDPPVGSVDA